MADAAIHELTDTGSDHPICTSAIGSQPLSVLSNAKEPPTPTSASRPRIAQRQERSGRTSVMRNRHARRKRPIDSSAKTFAPFRA